VRTSSVPPMASGGTRGLNGPVGTVSFTTGQVPQTPASSLPCFARSTMDSKNALWLGQAIQHARSASGKEGLRSLLGHRSATSLVAA
jgi:hypothetical protein